MITRNRKISVDDYPEHLNPFADDNEDLRNNRFNTTGRRRARPSLKDAWSGGWEAEAETGGAHVGAEVPAAGGGGGGGGGVRRASASASASPVAAPRYGSAALGRTQSDSYRLRYTSRSGYQALMGDAVDAGGGRQGQLGRAYSFSYGRRESNPSPALDVAVPVRGPTPARPPPPRLSLSPPPPPPSEVQRQPPPPRPLTQPPPPAPAPAPDATPGKPSRRRFSFSRTLDAGSRLLLSPALLRRFRPGAAPASAKPPPRDRDVQPPAAPDLRGSIRRSQSQAIPTTPPPIGDASGLNSRAGSNWTLAEGGFPQRIPSYRPKKRRAPPPPVPAAAPAPAPPAVSVTPPPAETSVTTNAEQPADVSQVGPAVAEVTETTTVVVTVAPATPPPSSPEEPPALEVSVAAEEETAAAAGRGSPAQVADESRTPVSAPAPGAGDHQETQAEGVAPLAEGEDDADLAGADGSRQDGAGDKTRNEAGQPQTENTSKDRPSSDAVASAEAPAPSEAEPPSANAEEAKEEQAVELSEKIVGGSDTVQLTSAAGGEADLPPESSSSKLASGEITPQVLTLTIREYKEPTAPSAEATEVSQEAKNDAEGETGGNLPVEVIKPTVETVEVEVKVETASAPEPAAAAVSDIPAAEKNAKEASEDGAEENAVVGESPKSTLSSFREDYLTKHYKGDLPVLQITESDLADEKESEDRKEGSPVTKLSTALPVLHISEEDLRDEPEAEESSEAAAPERASNGPSPALREKDREGEVGVGGASPSPRRSLDGGGGRRESPQPPPRQSSAQELNSKIYFRVLPPLAGGGGPPQLKTFAPPGSPPGRGPKPQPPLRNGVAAPAPASAPGEASPPRTKSPLPTPRRRHQPVPRDA